MPFMNVKVVGPQLDGETKRRLIGELTDIIVDTMHRSRELTVIAMDEIDPSSWAIGGKPVDAERDKVSFVNLKVSKGTTNPDEMAAVLRETKEAMSRVLGNHIEANYMIIDELNPDGWGFDGVSMSERARSGK